MEVVIKVVSAGMSECVAGRIVRFGSGGREWDVILVFIGEKDEK